MEKKINIAFTGPECSGKTELALELAKFYHAHFVREYAREYLEKTNGYYEYSDLEKIAKKQLEFIQNTTHPLNFIDTELLVIEIWSRVRFQKCNPFILKNVMIQPIDLYILCTPDIPWEYDPLRENPYDRQELFELYKKKLESEKLPFITVNGNMKSRLNFCKIHLDRILK